MSDEVARRVVLDHCCQDCDRDDARNRIADEIRRAVVAEREACARTIEKLYRIDESLCEWPARSVARVAAAAIRARR